MRLIWSVQCTTLSNLTSAPYAKTFSNNIIIQPSLMSRHSRRSRHHRSENEWLEAQSSLTWQRHHSSLERFRMSKESRTWAKGESTSASVATWIWPSLRARTKCHRSRRMRHWSWKLPRGCSLQQSMAMLIWARFCNRTWRASLWQWIQSLKSRGKVQECQSIEHKSGDSKKLVKITRWRSTSAIPTSRLTSRATSFVQRIRTRGADHQKSTVSSSRLRLCPKFWLTVKDLNRFRLRWTKRALFRRPRGHQINLT